MKLFEKGKIQIIIFLAVYVLISVGFVLLSFSQETLYKFSYVNIARIYAGISVVYGLIVYFYTKAKFEKAAKFEKISEARTDIDKEEQNRKAQDIADKASKQKKAEEEKIAMASKLAEITKNLDDKSEAAPFFDQLLINISKPLDIVQGVAYLFNNDTQKFSIISTYAYYSNDTGRTFEIGEGIPGQVAKDQKLLQLDNVPSDYVTAGSGLGSSTPQHLVVIPIVSADKTMAILELAAFSQPVVNNKIFFEMLNEKISEKVAGMVK